MPELTRRIAIARLLEPDGFMFHPDDLARPRAFAEASGFASELEEGEREQHRACKV